MASSGCVVRRLVALCVTTSILVHANITGTSNGDPLGLGPAAVQPLRGGDIAGLVSASASLYLRALQGEEPGLDLGGRCPCGFVALFALQGHLSALRGDAEDAASLLRLPLGPMLGPHLGFDFPESSSWPLRSRDIAALPTCGQVFRERARLRGRS
uniref:Phospholipase B-like n=1 Tax=Alexandrium monilatum TaxID=311494 RepID=A0A6T1N3V9_9DINO